MQQGYPGQCQLPDDFVADGHEVLALLYARERALSIHTARHAELANACTDIDGTRMGIGCKEPSSHGGDVEWGPMNTRQLLHIYRE